MGENQLSTAVVERIRSRVGATVSDKYHLDRLLGVGGTASVFAATHRNGSRVALKVLHAEFSKLKDVRARFLREGYAANKVGHGGVVRVHDDGEDEGSVFLVMELLEGETIEARWERVGNKLPLADVLDWVDRLLDTLAAAHQQGIVHRDIKPENLFLTRSGELKILDFGIARLLDGTGATQSGALMGTPAFMAPEQAGGRTSEIDPRTDLWSVGATMFTLLSGRPVHDYPTPTLQVVYAAGTSARSAATVAPELPSDVVRLVDTALSFHPEVRWQTAREMQAAVRAARAMTTAPTKQAAKLVVVSFESDETSPSSVPAQVNVTSNPTLPMGSAHTPSEPARK